MVAPNLPIELREDINGKLQHGSQHHHVRFTQKPFGEGKRASLSAHSSAMQSSDGWSELPGEWPQVLGDLNSNSVREFDRFCLVAQLLNLLERLKEKSMPEVSLTDEKDFDTGIVKRVCHGLQS